MKRKLVITKFSEKILTTLLEDEVVTELHCVPAQQDQNVPMLGNIYVGRVKKIVPNLKVLKYPTA